MNKSSIQDIACATIEWRNDTPYSLDFEDFYYHSGNPFEDNGLRETEYLFLQQNSLPQRWQDLSKSDCSHQLFTIGETGFGTGLNFLCACDLWLKTAPKGWRLQFISSELKPLHLSDLKAIHRSWDCLQDLSTELIDQYPEALSGVHLIELAGGRIQLYLMLGEANDQFQQIAESSEPALANYAKHPIDAWFLDGFAPAKNPQLWCDEIFNTVASLSGLQTTFATFTCASHVRKGLSNAGFEVRKIAGFGRKRESLAGSYTADKRSYTGVSTPWYLNKSPPSKHSKQVLVLGAGIAGCTTAVALAKKGFDVKVVDRHPTAGQEGSGNPQAIVYPKLSVQRDQLPRINLTAMLLASRYYQPFWEQGLGAQCGVLLLPVDNKAALEFQRIGARFTDHQRLVRTVDNQQICALSGIHLYADQGLYFPSLGWLPPSQVCQRLLQDSQIPLIQADISRIYHCAESDLWHMQDDSQQSTLSASTLVIANAYGCQQFEQTEFLNVTQLRGQVTHVPSNPASEKLKTVICGSGYIAPAQGGIHSVGATYNKGLLSTELREEDQVANLANISTTDRGIAEALANPSIRDLPGRANYRCTSRDYLPMVGAVPDVNAFKQTFDTLRFNAKGKLDQMGTYLPNLYVNCSMGSRGLSYAPLTAEILACEISGQIAPLERELRNAMHPARFIIRDLKRRKI